MSWRHRTKTRDRKAVWSCTHEPYFSDAKYRRRAGEVSVDDTTGPDAAKGGGARYSRLRDLKFILKTDGFPTFMTTRKICGHMPRYMNLYVYIILPALLHNASILCTLKCAQVVFIYTYMKVLKTMQLIGQERL